MRNISAYECQLLSSLNQNPSLIHLFNDLERKHFSSEYPWLVYSNLIKMNDEEMQTTGCAGVITKLSANKKISAEERDFCFIDYGLALSTGFHAEQAYEKIKNEDNKISLLNRLNAIDFKNMDYEDIVSSLDTEISKENYKLQCKDTFCTLADIQKEIGEKQVNLAGITFGLKTIDEWIKLERDSFVVISARPFQGKTTFACGIAMENIKEHLVLYYSLEMSKSQIWKKVKNYPNKYDFKNFIFIRKPESSISDIVRTALKLDVGLVIIDQFNKLTSDHKDEYSRFTENARKLKIEASRINIPIIALAQINRSVENNAPQMHNIKGSGSFEEEADVVIMLHAKKEDKETSIIVDKNRTHDEYISKKDCRFINNKYEEI